MCWSPEVVTELPSYGILTSRLQVLATKLCGWGGSPLPLHINPLTAERRPSRHLCGTQMGQCLLLVSRSNRDLDADY